MAEACSTFIPIVIPPQEKCAKKVPSAELLRGIREKPLFFVVGATFLCNGHSMNLADAIRKLRGEQTYLEFSNKTKVNRTSLARMEEGQSVKLSTLEQIARKVHLTDEEWIQLLIAWIRAVIGPDNCRKLSIQPAPGSQAGMIMNEADNRLETLRHFFTLLTSQEQEQVMKTIQRQEVLRCLGPINQVFERFTTPGHESKNHLSSRY